MLNQKQNNLLTLANGIGVDILNIQDYQNKESYLKCKCKKCGHIIEGSVETLLKVNFECLNCLSILASNVEDRKPFFLSLDAASYTTGMSIFNIKGQLLGHKTFNTNKKDDFLTRVKELRNEVIRLIKENEIKCVILEDIQYQQNPALFKKLAMLQGILRYAIVEELDIELITAMADEWRSYNHIFGGKRQEQKRAAMERARSIFHREIPEDESESIFLGYYGISRFNSNIIEDD